MKKLFIVLAIITALIFTATVGYLLFQNQKLINLLSGASPPPLAQETSQNMAIASPEPSVLPPPMTLASLQENIEAAVNSRNTQAMASYMTNPVHVILQATECCGEMTPDEAIAQASYVEPGVPFNFDQEDATIKNLKLKNPELANTFIGISNNMEHLAAFTINNQNKIAQIRFSVSWKLFTF